MKLKLADSSSNVNRLNNFYPPIRSSPPSVPLFPPISSLHFILPRPEAFLQTLGDFLGSYSEYTDSDLFGSSAVLWVMKHQKAAALEYWNPI